MLGAMDREGTAQQYLDRVKRHVALGEQRIDKQLALIEQLGRGGYDTRAAKTFLATLEETQRLHLQHQDRLMKELSKADRAESRVK